MEAGDRELRGRAVGSLRSTLREILRIQAIEGGSPHLSEPFYWRVPGLDAPDLRVDGRPIGPLRWPETPLLSVPSLAVRSAVLRRSTPIDGPLSATGGPLLDLRLHSAPLDSAISAVRLTRASYATFTEEIVFRRRIGSGLLFSGFYGDEKTAGRDLWGGQFSETIGLRASHPYRGGSLEWGYDAARYRANLLASKRQLWTAVGRACGGRGDRRRATPWRPISPGRTSAVAGGPPVG